jgi:hypothetical protein
MNVLLDQGVPAPLCRELEGHKVATAFQQNWSTLTNGELLESAEQAGFDLLITTDQNLKYQQNLKHRKIAIVVLLTTSWPRIRKHLRPIRKVVSSVVAGDYQEIQIPWFFGSLLINHSILHHKNRRFHSMNIRQRIARNGDDVGKLADLQRTDFLFPAEQRSGVHGTGHDRFHGR